MWRIKNLQIALLTDRGLERARNEDSCFAKAESELGLLVVADGMGGHQAGNIASSLAVSAAENFWEGLDRSASLAAAESRQAVRGLIIEANKAVIAQSLNYPSRRGMGTTITAGLLCGSRLTIGHVGDSRAYMINNESIKLLTKDHSLLEELIDSGEVRPEEGQNHPQRHVLTRAVGITEDLEVDIFEQELEKGSTILFCTDGLTNLVDDDEILTECLEQPDPQKLAEKLIAVAKARGGHDNITVVVAAGIGGQHV